ncbi:MBL fold metallo-hydrolase [Rhodococcus rhodnii]|uniref:Metallo-beta-lactamase domain-containing protein n=2 Tax=Rhodococcus rhodnii TaxID=38312 RepID=R7WSK7_9NOCA|nr:MBL fold metallo-hydrolase [Rhodococcus rhodnii]EOM76969.1 hypothetical protein Rrhod_1588 [Rhodococcus rhodnii LMG 5362]TXG89946.1 MBL fold metallo-hydrolase [Rhodococcus rhodnii]
MTAVRVTGDAQKQAWADRVMPPVEHVRPGLWSIPVPMPGNPLRYVLVYALALPDGIALIDAGWASDESWRALTDGLRHIGSDVSQVRYIAVTHLHPDHFGLVPRVLEHTDAVVAMHRADAHHLTHLDRAALTDEKTRSARQLRQLGAPPPVADSHPHTLVRFAGGRTVDVQLSHGDPLQLDGWDLRAVWTPGHTPGHLCFVDDAHGLVFSGDHLLPRISPNVSVIPGQLDDPLAEYLASLTNTVTVPDDYEALPSHEYRFAGIAQRARDLLAHHEERLDEIAAVVADRPESTSWDVTESVTWSRPFAAMSADLRRMAVRETHAHLVVLADRGVVRRCDESPLHWFATGPAATAPAETPATTGTTTT